MPADQRQFEKQAQRRGKHDRHVDIADVELVEKLRLRQRIGVEQRLELAQQRVKPPGGDQRHGREQDALEHEGGRGKGRIARAAAQAQRHDDAENDEGAAADRDEQAQHRPDHSGFFFGVVCDDAARSPLIAHSIGPLSAERLADRHHGGKCRRAAAGPVARIALYPVGTIVPAFI